MIILFRNNLRNTPDKGLVQYLETGKSRIMKKLIELSAVRRNKEEFPIELAIMPVSQGNDEFYCAFIRDITDTKKS